MVIVDAEGRISLVNRQTERLFGYARHELVGQPVEMLLPEAIRDRHSAQRRAYTSQPEVRPMGVGSRGVRLGAGGVGGPYCADGEVRDS